jgi:hypothetical protein
MHDKAKAISAKLLEFDWKIQKEPKSIGKEAEKTER